MDRTAMWQPCRLLPLDGTSEGRQVGPPGFCLAGDVGRGNLVVLRSFGKFFGLAGMRLGFALLDQSAAVRLAAKLGPWTRQIRAFLSSHGVQGSELTVQPISTETTTTDAMRTGGDVLRETVTATAGANITTRLSQKSQAGGSPPVRPR